MKCVQFCSDFIVCTFPLTVMTKVNETVLCCKLKYCVKEIRGSDVPILPLLDKTEAILEVKGKFDDNEIM